MHQNGHHFHDKKMHVNALLCSEVVCFHGALLYAGPPSPPMNLHYTVISTTTDTVVVRLHWDPPMNNGGVTITNYLIFVNGSQEVGSNCTNVTLTLNSTGQHFLQINAVNDCGLVGDITSVIVSGTCSAIGFSHYFTIVVQV